MGFKEGWGVLMSIPPWPGNCCVGSGELLEHWNCERTYEVGTISLSNEEAWRLGDLQCKAPFISLKQVAWLLFVFLISYPGSVGEKSMGADGEGYTCL